MIKQLNEILTKKQKIKMVILLFMMVIGAVFETVGVSFLLYLVSIIMEPDVIFSNKYLNFFYSFFHMENVTEYLIFIICAMIALYIIKNSFLLFLSYVQAKTLSNIQFKLSEQLLVSFLNRPYEYYLNANTGDIIRIVQWDVGNVYSILNNLLLFVSELFVALCLGILLIVLNPVMTFGILLILGITMIFSKKIFQRFLSKEGEKAQNLYAKINQCLIQSTGGIKDIKILHKERYFLDEYRKYGKNYASAQKKNAVLSQAPRQIIETASMCGMLIMMAVLLSNGSNINSMLPQISAFAMAAVRLMPSANRMNTYLNAISFLEPSLQCVWRELKKEKCTDIISRKQNGKITDFTKSIEMKDISYAYPNTEKKLFQKAYMEIRKGNSIGVVGTSGSGKTTAIDIILGLLKPENGKVTIDGIDIEEDYCGWLSKLGYIPQSIFMLDTTIRKNVAFGVKEEEIDDERVWAVLEDAQLAQHIKTLPEGLDTEIGEKGIRLSGGQRQRLGIARALYHDPEILIFDEATSALDNDTEAAIMESVQRFQGRKTMIIIAHRLGTIANCDMVYRVQDGKIALEK